MDVEPGKCAQCGHNHDVGVTCSRCGCKAKKTKMNMVPLPVVKAYTFKICKRDRCLWHSCKLVRHMVFVDELGRPERIEFRTTELHSHHQLEKFGDALVGASRWRKWTPPGASVRFALFDRLCIVPHQRRRGFGTTMFKYTLQTMPDAMPWLVLLPKHVSFAEERMIALGFAPLGIRNVEGFESIIFFKPPKDFRGDPNAFLAQLAGLFPGPTVSREGSIAPG